MRKQVIALFILVAVVAWNVAAAEVDGAVERHPELAQWHRSSIQAVEQAASGGNAQAQYYVGLSYFYGEKVAANAAVAIKWFRAAAQQGYAPAQRDLGWMYGNAKGVPRNREEALKWVGKAAEQEYVPAFLMMGWLHANIYPESGGGEIKGDYVEAAEWYEKAASKGSVEGAFQLGELCHYGKLGNERRPEAAKWLRIAAEKGHPEAQAHMGELASGPEAMKWLKPAAERGSVQAQWKLARLYDEGSGGAESNPAEALKWYERVANSPRETSLIADAIFQMGVMRAIGRGAARNDARALETFRSIADWSMNAQNAVGYMLATGRGASVNHAEAFKWFQKASQRSIYARAALGCMYAAGHGVKQDFAEAMKWLGEARRSHSRVLPSVPAIAADVNFAICTFNGWGAERDEPEAARLFRSAAKMHDAQAQLNLGLCYLHGRGFRRDPYEAFMWFELASQQGEPGAAALRDEAGRILTDAQRTMAMKRSQGLSQKPRSLEPQEVIWNPGPRLPNIKLEGTR